MRITVCVISILFGSAVSAAAADPPPQWLPVERVYYETVDQFFGGPVRPEGARFAADYFRVGAPSPLLAARISLAVLDAAGVSDANPLGFGSLIAIDCVPGWLSTELVSFVCGTLDGGAGTNYWITGYTYLIVGDTLKPLTADQVFKPNVRDALAKLAGTSVDDGLFELEKFLLREDGIVFVYYEDGDARPRFDRKITWAQLTPYLAPGFVRPRLPPPLGKAKSEAAGEALPRASFKSIPAPSGTPRFALHNGVVSDKATGLEWAERDNGSDLTHAEALAWARAYRGGGHDDWRLPTLAELTRLRDLQDLHKDEGDCFKGRFAVALTPLIDASCAQFWARDRSDDNVSAFGFVEGKHYWVKPSTQKNYRALVVRWPSSR